MTIFFLSSLGLIAALVIGSYALTSTILDEEEATEAVADLGSHQRNLAYRIITQLGLYVDERQPAQRDTLKQSISSSITELVSNQNTLSAPDMTLGIATEHVLTAQSIQFEEPYYLNDEINQLVNLTNEIIEQPWSLSLWHSKSFEHVNELLQGNLIAGLDAIVAMYENRRLALIDRLEKMIITMTILVIATISIIGLFIFLPLFRKLSVQTRELVDQARTDPLTGCFNRRTFMISGEVELARFKRHNNDLCVLMLDIDHFKKVNDTYGHHVGDDVICSLVMQCLSNLRKTDILGRIGGEEFAIVLPDTKIADGTLVAEKIRKTLSETAVPYKGGELNYTASFGICTATEKDETLMDVLNRADFNMYEAKSQGRNRVVSSAGVETSKKKDKADGQDLLI